MRPARDSIWHGLMKRLIIAQRVKMDGLVHKAQNESVKENKKKRRQSLSKTFVNVNLNLRGKQKRNKKLELYALSPWLLNKRSKASQDARVHITGFCFSRTVSSRLFFSTNVFGFLRPERRLSREERGNSIYRVLTSCLFRALLFSPSSRLWMQLAKPHIESFALEIIHEATP